jgi:hypothetical protein
MYMVKQVRCMRWPRHSCYSALPLFSWKAKWAKGRVRLGHLHQRPVLAVLPHLTICDLVLLPQLRTLNADRTPIVCPSFALFWLLNMTCLSFWHRSNVSWLAHTVSTEPKLAW